MTWSLLTTEEKKFFDEQGYLVIPDALSRAQVDGISAAIVGLCAPNENQLHNTADIFGRHDTFLELIDLPTVFPKIFGILGWNIWANHTHFNVNPPEPPASPGQPFAYEWHRDGGAIAFDLGNVAAPLLCTKVGFYLTDLTTPGHGQTYIVPRSHRLESNQFTQFEGNADTLEFGPNTPPEAIGAIALNIAPGTAVIYDRRTIHSAYSPNVSPTTRLAVFVNYAFRWLQPMDMTTVEKLRDRCDPVRQQLLGLSSTVRPLIGRGATGMSGRYYPSDEDVPLRRLLRERLREEANRYSARAVDG